MKVYAVYCAEQPDLTYAIFASKEDAEMHQQSCPTPTRIEERTLFYGQANNPGYNE